jgi:acetyltransferase
LPADWSRANPVDVVGDAKAERFVAALRAVERDPGVDAVLVIHCPTALASGAAIATALAAERDGPGTVTPKPLIACWLGAGNADTARPIFAASGTPLFDNLDDAVRGFGYLVAADAAQAALLRAPATSAMPKSDPATARAVIEAARGAGRTVLSAVEAKTILAAFGVPVARSVFVADVADIADACAELRPPFVVKLVCDAISHKSDIGGVVLDLADAEAAGEAALAIRERVHGAAHDAVISGFEIGEMVVMPQARELLVGVADDPQFGPVIAVGAGGVDVELIGDRTLGLPPLDTVLARDMLDRTRVSRLLAAHRGRPAADSDAVVRALEAVSALCVELPDVVELDINPLLVGPEGAIALDARMRITPQPAESRMVLRPVPMQWATDLVTRSGVALHVRPVLPSDEWMLAELFHNVSAEDKQFRFLGAVREIGHAQLAAMTQVDYRRTINFLAFVEDGTLVASAMLASTGDKARAELALSVHQDWKSKGVGWTLAEHALRYARAEGVRAVESLESRENRAAIALERELGFQATACDGSPAEVIVRKELI